MMEGGRPGNRDRVVALTGACGYLGAQLILALEADSRYDKVVALDVSRPPVPLAKTVYHRVDLTSPTAGNVLAGILEKEQVDTFVHLAFLYDVTHRTEWAHELESVGTMHVLDACAQVGISHFILWSRTMCYGAKPSNPSRLSEDAPLWENAAPAFIADKVDAERQAAEFARQRPDTVVTVLRTAPIVARGVDNVLMRYLSLPLVPVLAGHDPLVQLLAGVDAVDAFKLVIDRPAGAVFNIVGGGVLPLKTVLAVLGKAWIPFPGPVADGMARALWTMQFGLFPPEMTDYLRYLVVADGTKAAEQLGWRARHDLLSVLESIGEAGKGSKAVSRRDAGSGPVTSPDREIPS